MNWNSRVFYNKNNKKTKIPKFGEKRKFSELNIQQNENNNLLLKNISTGINNQINNLSLKNLNINNSNINKESSLNTAIKENTNAKSLFVSNANENLVVKGNLIFCSMKLIVFF